MNNRLKTTYFTPSNPGAFGGVDNLQRNSGATRKQTLKFLQKHDAYTLHKPRITKFRRNKYFVYGIGDLLEIDLVDMNTLKEFNEPYAWMLTVIDCFSRKADAIPLRNKTAGEVKTSLETILNRFGYLPLNIRSDSGREFVNRTLGKYLKDQ